MYSNSENEETNLFDKIFSNERVKMIRDCGVTDKELVALIREYVFGEFPFFKTNDKVDLTEFNNYMTDISMLANKEHRNRKMKRLKSVINRSFILDLIKKMSTCKREGRIDSKVNQWESTMDLPTGVIANAAPPGVYEVIDLILKNISKDQLIHFIMRLVFELIWASDEPPLPIPMLAKTSVSLLLQMDVIDYDSATELEKRAKHVYIEAIKSVKKEFGNKYDNPGG